MNTQTEPAEGVGPWSSSRAIHEFSLAILQEKKGRGSRAASPRAAPAARSSAAGTEPPSAASRACGASVASRASRASAATEAGGSDRAHGLFDEQEYLLSRAARTVEVEHRHGAA